MIINYYLRWYKYPTCTSTVRSPMPSSSLVPPAREHSTLVHRARTRAALEVAGEGDEEAEGCGECGVQAREVGGCCDIELSWILFACGFGFVD